MEVGAPGADQSLHDRRIERITPLDSPEVLMNEHPLTASGADGVVAHRDRVKAVLDGRDPRLMVVVGPCSVHDPKAALEYAQRLAAVAPELEDLLIVMRVYFEKPRTTTGWKGLINDPGLDDSFDVNRGMRLARDLLLDVLELGLPVGTEYLDPITPQYIADAVSWGAIGARTTESQTHRQLASGLSMPIGFKNRTDGDVGVAVDAVRAAAAQHVFSGVELGGGSAILTTTGNEDCHVILRGGAHPNHDPGSVSDVLGRLREVGLPERVVIDASHGNSGKDHTRQPRVAQEIGGQVADGNDAIVGVMLESFLVGGNQPIGPDLTYGQSVTDKCMDWETTVEVLRGLDEDARTRRTRG